MLATVVLLLTGCARPLPTEAMEEPKVLPPSTTLPTAPPPVEGLSVMLDMPSLIRTSETLTVVYRAEGEEALHLLRFDWGDGSAPMYISAEGRFSIRDTLHHTYDLEGQYTIRAEILDRQRQEARQFRVLRVIPPA